MDTNTLTLVSVLATLLIGIGGFTFSLLFLHNQSRQEQAIADELWAKLKTEGDERWLAVENKILGVESKILAIMERLQMTAPSRAKGKNPKDK